MKPRPQRGSAAQRVSLRLPVPLAARLAALGEMHPGKSRSELLNDLLTLAITQVEHAAPQRGADMPLLPHAGTPPVYLVSGPFPEFHHLVLKHHLRLERERAAEDPEPGAADDGFGLVDDE
jgi:hypothetical protein